MHTRHWAVIALGAVAAVFGISEQEFTVAQGLIAALISGLGIADYIKGWKFQKSDSPEDKEEVEIVG